MIQRELESSKHKKIKEAALKEKLLKKPEEMKKLKEIN